MENLLIERTSQSPKVELKTNGELLISGVSTLSHVQKFYSVILDWLNEFKTQSPKNIDLVLEMYYMNTSSALMFVDILRDVNTFKSENSSVQISWKYEEDDEDILSLGEQLESATHSKFTYIPVVA